MAFGGLLGCLVWAPLPLGSNRPWAVGLLASALWLLLLVWTAGAAIGGHSRLRIRPAMAALPLALLGLLALLVAAQMWPTARTWGLGTLDNYSSRIYLLTTLAHAAAFTLIVVCVSNARRANWLLGTVVMGGVLQALLAVGLYSTGAEYQFLFTDFSQGGRATGTYPNPDHLAGYMELCLAAGLGLLLAQFGRESQASRGWRQRTLHALEFLMSGKMLLRLMLVVMVVALVMTHSRMGNGAFFLALLFMGCWVATVSPGLRRPAMWLVASMAVIDIFIIGQWVGLDKVVQRMQGTAVATRAQAQEEASLADLTQLPRQSHREESLQDRLAVPALSLPLVAQRPWFGHGGGTYFLVLPSVKPAGFPNHWDHAHNDYVEVAVNTGLLGLALWLMLGLTTAWRAARMLRDSQPRLNRGIGAAALMALSCMGLHSMVDFNLQIPANAMTLLALLALVWAMPHRSGSLAAATTGPAQ